MKFCFVGRNIKKTDLDMIVNKLIDKTQKDSIGKHYFSKAVYFALNKEFGKSYEFFKEGLDILTCDCVREDWLKLYTDSEKKLFDDINIKHIPHFEYYFVKAYLLSYGDEKKSLYLALDAIEKYLESRSDEYGNYVKGKILLALDEPRKALESFEIATSYITNPRLLYRLGRTKEQLLNESGLEELYFSFRQNPTSVCCARVLRKYMKERGNELDVEKDQKSNLLLIEFNSDGDDVKFQRLYEKVLKNQLNESSFETGKNTALINSFILEVINNSRLFIEETEEEDYGADYNESDCDNYEDQTDWTHYDDNLDMDQQDIEFWNQF